MPQNRFYNQKQGKIQISSHLSPEEILNSSKSKNLKGRSVLPVGNVFAHQGLLWFSWHFPLPYSWSFSAPCLGCFSAITEKVLQRTLKSIYRSCILIALCSSDIWVNNSLFSRSQIFGSIIISILFVKYLGQHKFFSRCQIFGSIIVGECRFCLQLSNHLYLAGVK